MSKVVTPIVLSDGGDSHEAMTVGEVLPVSSVPVSTNKQNLIGTDDTGLLLTGEDIVSKLDRNPLVVQVDGKLYASTKAMLSPEDKVLKVTENLVRADITLAFDEETSTLILYGKDKTEISKLYLPIVPGVPTEMEVLENYTPPKPAGFVENPYQRGVYLHIRYRQGDGKEIDTYVDMGKLVDKYIGGDGISVSNKVISVLLKENGGLKFDKCSSCSDSDCPCDSCGCAGRLMVDTTVVANKLVAADDKVLTVKNNQLATELRLGYNADEHKITLYGANDVKLGTAVIDMPEIPGLPTRAEFVENPFGYPVGTYLHLRFELNTGEDKDLYLDVTKLVDIYTGGEAIEIKDKAVSVIYDGTMRIIDNKLGVKTLNIVGPDDKLLSVNSNKVISTLGLEFRSGVLYVTGNAGVVVAQVEIPLADGAGRPTSADWLMNYTPAGGGETGTYLRLHYPEDTGLEDFLINFNPVVYAAGDGLRLEDTILSVRIPEDGPFKFTGNKELDIILENLVSKVEDNVLQKSSVDDKLYVKDSGLSADKIGHALEVNKSSGNLRVVAGELVGWGIEGDKDTLSVKTSEIVGKGLEADSSTKVINVKPADFIGKGLEVGGDGKMRVKASDIVTAANGLSVNSGMIVMDAVALSGVLVGNGLEAGDSGAIAVKPADFIGKGLEVGGDGKMRVKASDIVTAANGLSVNSGMIAMDMPVLSGALAGNGLEADGSGAIKVKPTDFIGKGLEVGSDGKMRVKMPDIVTVANGLSVSDGKVVMDLSVLCNALADTETGLKADPITGKIGVDLDKLADLISAKIVAGVSEQTGNMLAAGTDGRPFLPADLGNMP